ncbi:SDR family NAD(P)-dependent oxidoreductase [Rugamonas sp. FT107W]|uniref:SDR family NAD(P)-dependent oxidoreductase n=1 Tax=Duganella vulcania TaxID=2692166 RepID=A0A845HUU7_9BURK|nr:SDR family oxidoreductase [Duganella vulcania]MYN21149.1 SDR family NAD(P)-dependent oxidoreductase [Duganella vulcania]
MKTILITGCSSGFGLETAQYFLEREWNVVATMRTPREDVLPPSSRLRVLALDVTDADSIRRAVEAAGPVDVLVNNAGIGVLGALEGTSMDTAREVFTTNTLGTIAMTQAVLPQFRQRRTGVIVNVTSSVTLTPLPLLSVYTASKAAVNAFTESLALELQQFNVRAHLVLPGRAPATRFGENAQSRMDGAIPEAYAELAQNVFAGWAQSSAVTQAAEVAEAIWRAATDPSCPPRLAAGADAVALSMPSSAPAVSIHRHTGCGGVI